jgi:integrase
MHTSGLNAPLAGLGAPSTRPRSDASMSFAELADAYMAAYAGRDRSRPRTLGFWFSHFADRPFASITDDDVFAGLETLRSRPARIYVGKDADGRPIHRAKGKLAPTTVNRYHATLMALFTWAIKNRRAPRGWDNPARRVERSPEKNQVIRFLSEDERRRLLEACRASEAQRLYLLVVMAITTAARKSELLGLTWRDVDLDRAVAQVAATKNDHPKTLALTAPVVDELRRFKADRPEFRVFPSSYRPSAPWHFEKSWHTALERAEIRRFRFHDLRHTCASYLAQNGASLLEIADVLGHRQLAMVKRYAHLTTDTKAKLVNRVLGGIK